MQRALSEGTFTNKMTYPIYWLPRTPVGNGMPRRPKSFSGLSSIKKVAARGSSKITPSLNDGVTPAVENLRD